MGPQLSNGIVDIHSISPIVQAQKSGGVEPYRDSGKARIPKSRQVFLKRALDTKDLREARAMADGGEQ
jgi:hypothetical protein